MVWRGFCCGAASCAVRYCMNTHSSSNHLTLLPSHTHTLLDQTNRTRRTRRRPTAPTRTRRAVQSACQIGSSCYSISLVPVYTRRPPPFNFSLLPPPVCVLWLPVILSLPPPAANLQPRSRERVGQSACAARAFSPRRPCAMRRALHYHHLRARRRYGLTLPLLPRTPLLSSRRRAPFLHRGKSTEGAR